MNIRRLVRTPFKRNGWGRESLYASRRWPRLDGKRWYRITESDIRWHRWPWQAWLDRKA